MTKKEALEIQAWLEDENLVEAQLLRSRDPNEMELRLSKRNKNGQLEFLVIGLPILDNDTRKQKLNA